MNARVPSAGVRESFEPMADLAWMPFVLAPVYWACGWSPSPAMLLREGFAKRLLAAQEEVLEPLGMRWVVYDAWRPREAQARVWAWHGAAIASAHPGWGSAEVDAELARFVADPFGDQAPAHSTGGAADLGLWDGRRGRLADMGSAFDEFGPRAAPLHFEGVDCEARANRRVMAKALASKGIVCDPMEYFHADFGSAKWARARGEAFGSYGEVVACMPGAGGSCAAVFAEGEEEASFVRRVEAARRAAGMEAAAAKGRALPDPSEAATVAGRAFEARLAALGGR